MNLLRKLLHLEDHKAKARASDTEREIQQTKKELQSKLEEIEHRANQQTFNIKYLPHDRVLSDWGGAIDILRDRE